MTLGPRVVVEPDRGRHRLRAMPDHQRPRAASRPLSVLLVVVATLALAACGATGVDLPGTGPLITVQLRGGMCMDGPCDSSVILEPDGRVHDDATPPKELGRVPAQTMATLTAAVNGADYASIKSHPFTGECPVAFDGQEMIFEFSVGSGTQRIASCEVDIDWGHPLFVAVGVALGEWIPLPLT